MASSLPGMVKKFLGNPIIPLPNNTCMKDTSNKRQRCANESMTTKNSLSFVPIFTSSSPCESYLLFIDIRFSSRKHRHFKMLSALVLILFGSSDTLYILVCIVFAMSSNFALHFFLSIMNKLCYIYKDL